MPQPAQHSLIHVLLLWTTILSIIQAVFIILFFTVGHHGLSQNSSAVAPEHTMPFHSTSSPSEQELLLGKGKMLTFQVQAIEANSSIKWLANDPDNGLVSEGHVLTIKKDGYYFLNLQVALKTNKQKVLEHMVSLNWNTNVLLQGHIKKNTSSTGLLGKVEELSAGDTLEVTISPPTTDIDSGKHLTHLDIIYMVKP